MTTEWLPDLILMEHFGGNWNRYFEHIYAQFEADFVASKPTWPGKEVRLKWIPVHDGKSATFWHMISEGKVETNRTPDMRRAMVCHSFGGLAVTQSAIQAVFARTGHRAKTEWSPDGPGRHVLRLAVD